jgi:hypothetical protein
MVLRQCHNCPNVVNDNTYAYCDQCGAELPGGVPVPAPVPAPVSVPVPAPSPVSVPGFKSLKKKRNLKKSKTNKSKTKKSKTKKSKTKSKSMFKTR